VEKLSAAAARRIALAAQGFGAARPVGRVDRRHGRKVFDRVGVIQIDSVNVLVRSQELPMFARLGPHRRDLIPQMIEAGELFEYWAHMASLVPVEMQPLFRWKMEQAHIWSGLAQFARENVDYIEAVYDEVVDNGPLIASELADPGKKQGPWWGWNHGKQALECLFSAGRITARRRANFEREYDLPERMLPADVLAAPTPSPDDARRELLALSARSLGVATARDLCDYYRLNIPATRPRIAELIEDGRLVEVDVEGWKERAYVDPNAARPRRIDARTVLSPFDSLVWERARTERMWDFRYRIEIYTPAPKRQYGYYVLPFLLGDALVGRVDLKSDRRAGALVAQAAWVEPNADAGEVAGELADELREVAMWLELERVDVRPRGDLAGLLRAAMR
jgi:uncharacterized protein